MRTFAPHALAVQTLSQNRHLWIMPFEVTGKKMSKLLTVCTEKLLFLRKDLKDYNYRYLYVLYLYGTRVLVLANTVRVRVYGEC